MNDSYNPVTIHISRNAELTSGSGSLGLMMALAAVAHRNQTDKGGRPYILHPFRVMGNLETTDEELQMIAIGHDLLEDTWVTEGILHDLGFSPRVVEAIRSLTRLPGDTARDYRNRVLMNIDSCLVKMADLLDISNLRRLKGTTQRDVERSTKYVEFYMELVTRVQALKEDTK